MKRIAGWVLVVTVAALSATAYPVLAQDDFLILPKPEKKWMQYFYRAQGVAPAPKPSVLMDYGTAVGFDFLTTPDHALFLTGHPAYNDNLLGDLTGKNVTADFRVDGAGTFTYYGQGTPSNPCVTPANVRLYFSTTNNELGESQYWWSNPEHDILAAPTSANDLTAAFDPGIWSDRDGHAGTFDAAHTAAFTAAVADVQHIGLSFGGGCFFANGVGMASGEGTFVLTDFDVSL